ncbi:unnamed protein product [Closterium sp. NIES-53]
MATPSVLTFDADGRAVDFEVWVDDLQLFLQCDREDGLSLFDLTAGASPAPPATADSTVCSQWATRDAAARLAVCRHLPTTERAHFSQYKSAQTLYDAVVARYSSPATAALSRLILPYVFPDLAAFPTVADLITHLRTSDTRYRAALPAEDHFLSVCPTTLTVDLLEQCLLAAETSIVAREAPHRQGQGGQGHWWDWRGRWGWWWWQWRGLGRWWAWWRGCRCRQQQWRQRRRWRWRRERRWLRRWRRRRQRWSWSRLYAEEWLRWRSAPAAAAQSAGVAICDLDYDAILAALYAVSTSDEGDCYLCLPPDPGSEAATLGACEAAALGTSASAAPGAGESALSGTASAQVFHTFTLDSGASHSFFQDRTTLTPLRRPVAVSLADPSRGPVLASFSTVLPCLAAPSGTLSGLYLPSFSKNLVSGADLQDQGVDQFTPASQRVTHCTCAWMGRHLTTFTRQPGSSLYTLSTESPPVPGSGQVAASSQVFAAASGSGPESAPCSCRLLSHQTLLWHHRLGHPSLPLLRGMASRVLVSGLPWSLPPLSPGPAPTCVPCVQGRQRAAPHSSEFPPTEAPLQTLHMDVWRPARVRGQGHERYFLLVVDDYSRYTKTFTLPASPQQNGIAERRIGMVMDVAQTSLSLLWTGKVGDASVFRVWGSRAFVRDLSADKLSPRAVPCVFLGFPPNAPGWQFYHPTSRRPSVPLPSPPESSLPVLADPTSDSLRAASPTVARLLSTVVTDPSFESTAASALVAELVDFAARCRLDYAASLVAESASVCPPSVGGECALSTDVLEDRQEEFQCFAAALPHLVSTLIAPEGDPDAPDIPTPLSGNKPWTQRWLPGSPQAPTVKRPPGSPPVFKARYMARGFS